MVDRPKHLSYTTSLTRDGTRSNKNLKFYRTKSAKAYAKATARRGKNGAYHSHVEAHLHTERCEPHKCICRRG